MSNIIDNEFSIIIYTIYVVRPKLAWQVQLEEIHLRQSSECLLVHFKKVEEKVAKSLSFRGMT